MGDASPIRCDMVEGHTGSHYDQRTGAEWTDTAAPSSGPVRACIDAGECQRKAIEDRVRRETIEACAKACESFLDLHKNAEGLKLWPVRECVSRIRSLLKGGSDGH